MLLDNFHFLRPLWLAVIIPCVIMVILLWRQKSQQNNWRKVIAPHLLQHLLQGNEKRQEKLPLIALTIGWIITCIALAGPTWQKVAVPVTKSQAPLVVVADMSYNMLANDIKPNRLTRLRYKLLDLFQKRKEGLTALVVYAGSAHTVAPLTDDNRTLANLVNALSPEIMPSPGNSPSSGIEIANNLLQQGIGKAGNIVLITDHVSDIETRKIESVLKNSGHRLSIIGIGSEQGGPIPLRKGGFLKDNQGKIVIPQLEKDNLIHLANKANGKYHELSLDDTDLNAVLPKNEKNSDTIEVDRQFDQWHDAGFWLVLLLLPLALGAFRRGWVTVVLVAVIYSPTPPAMALDWSSLWKNENQRGAEALSNGQAAQAAELFTDPKWKAEAMYQDKKYQAAAELFGTTDTPADSYNKANAQAKAGKLQDAINSYDKALEQLSKATTQDAGKDKLKDDIEFNKSLVEKLLQNQQEQQDQQDNSQNQQDQQQNKKDQQNPSQGDNQQNNDQQNPEQDQQNQDKPQQGDSQQDPQKPQENDNNTKDEQPDSSSQQPESKNDDSKDNQKSDSQNNEQTNNDDIETEEQSASEDETPSTPDEQALESWLRTIPDDPGGLLRRKFLQQREQEQRERQEQAW